MFHVLDVSVLSQKTPPRWTQQREPVQAKKNITPPNFAFPDVSSCLYDHTPAKKKGLSLIQRSQISIIPTHKLEKQLKDASNAGAQAEKKRIRQIL